MESRRHDRDLVLAARAGDREAFTLLLTRHWPMLRALCRRALADPALAEDAAQEAAVQALLGLERLREAASFGPWLGGIGLNICRRWRRHQTAEAWSWETLHGGRQAPEEPASLEPTPEEVVDADETRQQVQRAIQALPPGQRAAVVLFYLGGFPQAEIARLLGTEVGAVKTRLHKARRALRRELWSLWQEDMMTTEHAVQFIEVRVADVRRRPVEDGDSRWRSVVVLEETRGARRMPIWIGPFEAEAIAMRLAGLEAPRPMTYAFMANLLTALGGRLQEARISRLTEQVFYATAVVAGPAGSRSLDARPSDAINLALTAGAPITVERSVFEAGANPPPDSGPAEWPAQWHGEGTQGAEEIAAALAPAFRPPDPDPRPTR